MREILTIGNLNKVRTIAIYGNIGSGKTSLAYSILELFKPEKKVYFLRHPKPELIEGLGFKNLSSLEKMEGLQDCVVYIDEPQLYISVHDKKTNLIIAKICSLARQLNITLIISSSDTRVFTKHNESFFDLWLVKNLDYDMVKRGSKIQKIIWKNTLFDPHGFRLQENEFVSECQKLEECDGKHTFEMLKHFTDECSKPYRK